MKKGDKVIVKGSAGQTCEGTIRSINAEKTHAVVAVPAGVFGPRTKQALRKLDDLEAVGGEKKSKAAKKKTTKKASSKGSKKKTSKKKASKKTSKKG